MSSESNKTTTADQNSSSGQEESDRESQSTYSKSILSTISLPFVSNTHFGKVSDVEEAKSIFNAKMLEMSQDIKEMPPGTHLKKNVNFWIGIMRSADPKKAKDALLPLARIRKIMKADEDVQVMFLLFLFSYS